LEGPVDSWKFDVEPEPYELRFREAKYAFVLIMGGDGNLGGQLLPDFYEMVKAVNEDVAALVLVDFPEPEEDEERPKTARVLEILPSVTKPVEFLPEISTGDPRPLADFLARALVSFSEETRIAIGFWGHGSGVFRDYDSEELALSREIRFGTLGEPVATVEMDARVGVAKEALSRSMLPDATSENSLTNREASSALAAAFSRARRTEPVDLLFFDTCMNASVEVFTELRPFAKTFVASSLLVPSTGWNYELWIRAIRKEKPATAEEWAFLAAGVFGATYDQRVCKDAAQMGAFTTSRDLDFVAKFAELVEALKRLGPEGVRVALLAADEAQKTVYEENVDLGHMVTKLGELSEDAVVCRLAEEFCDVYREAVLGLSMAPPGGEELTGMTVWCPVRGDEKGVSLYYEMLEFERLTGWLDLLRSGEDSSARTEIYSIDGFWGLELVEAQEVEETFVSREPDERKLWLSIPEMSEAFAGGLVEGEYVFHGGAGSIHFRSYVGLREFVRKLLELRDGEEFEALRGCCDPGWVIGGEVCRSLHSDFLKYQEAFSKEVDDRNDLMLYAQMVSTMRKVSDRGVLVFRPLD
jgi:cysteine peptidase C11 family protein